MEERIKERIEFLTRRKNDHENSLAMLTQTARETEVKVIVMVGAIRELKALLVEEEDTDEQS